MGLRFDSEEEFQEWMKNRRTSASGRYRIRENPYGGISRAEPAAAAPAEEPKKRNKYGNRRVEIDGMKFDSLHEARVWQELDARVKAGELRCVLRQVKFDLPGGIQYIADFVTIAPDMRVEVWDAKSEITRKNRVYINKRKQMAACWGIEVKEV